MKVSARCGYCLLHRGYLEILRSTGEEEVKFEAMRQLLRVLADEFDRDAVPSVLGSNRDRIVRKVTGCADPYVDMKRQANEKALEAQPGMEALIDGLPEGERLKAACLVACIGNIIEYDVPGHSPDLGEALLRIEEEGFYIDDLEDFEALLGEGVRVLYLCDNAGEIAFDLLVVRELRRLGCMVTVAVKGGPSLNDALLKDATEVGMASEADRVITTGTDAIGVNLSESSEEFRSTYHGVDVIVSKGMANWETLTEYDAPCPTLYLFRTKCEPVAASVGAPLQRNIAKLVPRGWRL